MLKSVFYTSLTLLLLAFWAAPSQAQGPEKQYNRELHFGTTLGGGFNPRLIYKKVGEKSVARYVIKFNSGTRTSTRDLGANTIYNSEILRVSNVDLAVGFGREWRTDVENRFQVYGGGDIELLYGINSTTRRRSQLLANGSSRDVEELLATTHRPGLAFHAFGGIRFAVTRRVSFAAEAGPRISGDVSFQKDENFTIDNLGTPSEELREWESSSQTTNINFTAIGPLYLQFVIHF